MPIRIDFIENTLSFAFPSWDDKDGIYPKRRAD